MSDQRYPEEFKIEAVKLVTERGLPVTEVAARLGMSVHSLYAWIMRYGKPQEHRQQKDDQHAELRRLRAELQPVTEERDILKRPPRTLPRSPAGVGPHQPPGASQRLLRLAGRAEIRTRQGRSAPARIDQACLVGKRCSLRLPKGPQRSA